MVGSLSMEGKEQVRSPSAVRRILVVDDEESIVLALCQHLALCGLPLQVGTAASAEEAQELLSRASVDVLVTDLRLPHQSGLDLIRQVREQSPETQTVLITAYGSEEVFDEARSNGCVACLEKPFSADELLDIILPEDRPSESSPLLHATNRARSRDDSALPAFPKVRATTKSATKAIPDFDLDDLVLAPEPAAPVVKRRSIEDFTERDLILQPDAKSEVDNEPALSPEEKNELVRRAVAIGISHFRKHQFSRARQAWKEALELEPTCKEALKNLGVLESIIKRTGKKN